MQQLPFSDTSYEKLLGEGKLAGSRCASCQALFVPPKPFCTKCFGTEMEWAEMSGKGKLFAFTVISICPPAMAAQGYSRTKPYCSGVVELEEGARVDARIEGVDTARPETIRVGSPMKVTFLRHGEGDAAETYLGFEPS